MLKPFIHTIIVAATFLLNTPASGHHEPLYLDDARAFHKSESALQHQIENLEATAGIYDLALYAPLKELGQLQQQAGLHEDAINSFRRMQHLIHRSQGVYSELQLESIDLLLNSYASLGRFAATDIQQKFRFSVADRAYEPDDLQHIGARLKLADWYRHSGRHKQALALYDEVFTALPEHQNNAHIRVLRSIAMTRYLSGTCCAAEPLYDALELVRSGDSHIEVVQALRDLNDMIHLETRTGLGGVVQVANLESKFLGHSSREDLMELMSFSEFSDIRSERYFDFGEREPEQGAVPTVGHPVAMCGTTYTRLAGKRTDLALDITVTITDEGKPANIEITGDGPGKLKRYLQRSLRSGKFRAATNEAGEQTHATLQFRQTFGTQSPAVTSGTQVDAWANMLVAQTCQVQGVQRI